jgi:hypothetical protein
MREQEMTQRLAAEEKQRQRLVIQEVDASSDEEQEDRTKHRQPSG